MVFYVLCVYQTVTVVLGCRGAYEIFSDCSGHCDNHCNDLPFKICPLKCDAGCICKKGYARNKQNRCVPRNQCDNGQVKPTSK